MKPRSNDQLAEGLRVTMDATGWGATADLVIDTTTERLCKDADDEARDTMRARLWIVWRMKFEAVMGGAGDG